MVSKVLTPSFRHANSVDQYDIIIVSNWLLVSVNISKLKAIKVDIREWFCKNLKVDVNSSGAHAHLLNEEVCHQIIGRVIQWTIKFEFENACDIARSQGCCTCEEGFDLHTVPSISWLTTFYQKAS